MKNILSFLIISAILLNIEGVNAQDNRTVSTKVADILNEIPARSVAQLEKAMRDMGSLPNEGFDAFFNHLQSKSSEINHQKARYALESYARHISKLSSPNEINQYNTRILNKLGNFDDYETQDFLLSTLQYTINASSIQKLGSLPDFPIHYDRVLNLMENSGSLEAKTFLEKLYYGSSIETTPAIVNALTRMKSFGIAGDLITQLKEQSPESFPQLHRAGHFHLSHAVSHSSYIYLKERAQSINFDPVQDNVNILQSFIDLMENAFIGNNKDISSVMFTDALQNFTADNQLVYRLQAVSFQLKYEQKNPKNSKLIQAELKNNDEEYRAGLLEICSQNNLGIPASLLLKTYSKSSTSHRQKILEYIIRQNDKALWEKSKKKINPFDNGPIEQFYYADLKFNGEAVINGILLSMNEHEDAIQPGIEAISYFLDNQLALTINDQLRDLIDKDLLAPPYSPVIQEVLDAIVPKLHNNELQLLEYYTLLEDEGISEAAYNGIVHLSNEQDLDRLIGYIKSIDSRYHKIILEGISKVINLFETEDQRYSAYQKLIRQTNDLEVAFQVAQNVGGYQVLKDILKYQKFDEYSVKVQDALLNWPDKFAIPHLFNQMLENKEVDRYFDNILRLCGTEIPGDQKLLYLRKLMKYAGTDEKKRSVLRELRTVKTYPAFNYVSRYLNNSQLEQVAARVLTTQALPSPGEEHGLYGGEIRETLEQVISTLKGGEAPYIQEDIRVYLRNMPEGNGFISMFNGTNLEGWKGFVANPIALSKMDSKEISQKQMEANEILKKNWSVENGWITFNGDGQNLVSIKEYGDFELYVDWRISKAGDSGIYLRGTPQVQIWDTSRVESGAQVGSGGLYNNQKNPSKPLKVADNPVNEWNTFHITMIDEKVTVYLNGELIVDEVVLENYWDRSQPIFPTGPIELQAHGTDLAFRDIYIREISSPDFSLTTQEKSEGFISLFNGANLDGWVGNKKDYRAESGLIMVDPQGGGRGNLYTEKEYDNFIFRFEFQLTPGANNGLGIHTPLEGDPAYVGKELQILDNTSPIYSDLYEWQYHGSVYGIIAAKRGYLKPVGEWNTEEVIVEGNRIKITLNGEVIVDGDYEDASKNGTLDGKDHPGIKRKSGHIGFLGHGSPLKFRNIRIKEL